MPAFDATTPPTPQELASAAAVTIKDENGKDVKLGDLYKDQTTIVIFIRHFVSRARGFVGGIWS